MFSYFYRLVNVADGAVGTRNHWNFVFFGGRLGAQLQGCQVGPRIRFTESLAPHDVTGGDAGQGLAIRVDGVDTLFPLGVGLLKAGQVIDLVSPGGGGFGPPPARDPDASARDRAEGLFGT